MFKRKHALAGGVAMVMALVWVRGVSAESVTLAAEDVEGRKGANVAVAVRGSDCQGMGGLQFQLRYDPAVLEWSSAELHSEAGAGLIDAKLIQPGDVRIALVSQDPIEGDAGLVSAEFEAIGESGSSSRIELDAARAWTHDDILELHVASTPGSVNVGGAGPPLWVLAGGILVLLFVGAMLRRSRGTAEAVAK